MAINKVTYHGDTLIDLTQDSVAPESLLKGVTAHAKDGELITGTYIPPEAGDDTSDATATASDILSGKTAYVDGEKVTGTIETKTSSNLTVSGATVTVPAGYYDTQATKSVTTATQATPSITVSSSGLITASATQTAGYVSAGTKSGTKQLTTQAAKTVTPTTSNQTAVASGRYTTGAVTVKGDANLKAENIASGVSIFGVTGTHSGAEDLNTELTTQENLISQLSTILDSKASGDSGGASIETCTVTITSDSNVISTCIATIYQDDEFGSVTIGGMSGTDQSTPIVISNVICGSSVHVASSYGLGGFTITNCEFTRMGPASGMFKITAPQGGSATIHCYNND